MTTVIDVIDEEARSRENELNRARQAVAKAIGARSLSSGGPAHAPELHERVGSVHRDLDETALVLAIDEALHP